MTGTKHAPVILLIDDNLNNLKVLQLGLSRNGYDVFSASSGAAALEFIQTTLPNIILLDVVMPGMNGFEVCSRLKAAPRTCDIPVIFVSSLDDMIDRVHGLEIGGVDYIAKPFELQDVLARVRIHLTLQQQKREIEERREKDLAYFNRINEIKQDLINQVTHDLKSPISSIFFSLELVRRHGRVDDDKGKMYLNRIAASSNQMRKLVADLLDVVKLETGYSLQLQTTRLVPFINSLIEALLPDAEHKSIELRLDLQAIDPDSTVEWDQEQMRRVFNNLLTNALKYTDVGGKVTVTVAQTNTEWLITIADTGIGIPEEALPRLFDRFFRVQNTDDNPVEGTGLGLYIVKSVVEQHGGRVRAESEYGRGSKFFVTLPL